MSRGAFAPVLGLLAAVLVAGTAQASTIQVNSLADSTAAGDGLCTLREAIVAANTNTASGGVAGECAAGQAAPTRDAIVFGVAGAIQPASPLPPVTELALVSGIGSIGSPDAPCPSFLPVSTIELDGVNAGGAGLQITAGSSVVRGLAIHRFPGSGILLTGAGGNRVQCNFIGTNPTGTLALGNGGRGVEVVGSDNMVGADGDGANDANEGNLISGNGSAGVSLRQLGTDRNRIAGNRIGTDTAGTAAIPNEGGGISVSLAAFGNIVGTNGDGVGDAAEGNLISGNSQSGVSLTDDSLQTRVSGNRIGTNADGSSALPNTNYGIFVAFSSDNVVGTNGDGIADASEGNLISGNLGAGVFLESSDTQHNRISGNRIGTNADGTTAIPNGVEYGEPGVAVGLGASGNFVGTNGDGIADALEGNLISGNGTYGVELQGNETQQNRISGNRIGTNAAGTGALPNFLDGIWVGAEAHDNIVGTNGDGVADAAEGNLISGNRLDGVRLTGMPGPIPAPPYQNRVSGNRIGTTADGTAALPNQGVGVKLSLGAFHNIVGTNGDGIADATEGNLIAFNGSDGIAVLDGNTLRSKLSRNSIFSNALLGIDLGGNGVTGNDPGDGDSGPNGLQNFPEIQSATVGGGGIEIVYSVPSPAPLGIEFFLADADSEEGRTFLGAARYAAAGSATQNLPAGTASSGDLVVATATDGNGNTSEFSVAMPLAAGTTNAIFGDGFESGDSLAWDDCVGCGP